MDFATSGSIANRFVCALVVLGRTRDFLSTECSSVERIGVSDFVACSATGTTGDAGRCGAVFSDLDGVVLAAIAAKYALGIGSRVWVWADLPDERNFRNFAGCDRARLYRLGYAAIVDLWLFVGGVFSRLRSGWLVVWRSGEALWASVYQRSLFRPVA